MGSQRPNTAELARFFRSLSTMHQVGIPLHQSLEHLSSSAVEGSAMKAIYVALIGDTTTGHRFSSALSRFPEVFDAFSLSLIKVGETTGRLDVVLSALADHAEWVWANNQKLKSTLTYPVLSLCFCLIMAIVGPAYLLRGQLEMLKTSGVELPTITKGLILFSDLFHNPLVLLTCSITLLIIVWWLPRELRKPGRKRQSYVLMSHIPVLSELLRINALSRFCRSLALLLQAGVTIAHALTLSFFKHRRPSVGQGGQVGCRQAYRRCHPHRISSTLGLFRQNVVPVIGGR